MERYGNHLRECKWERIQVDFPGHPMDGFLGWLVAVGSVITKNSAGYTVGDSDRLILLDDAEDPLLLHEERLRYY